MPASGTCWTIEGEEGKPAEGSSGHSIPTYSGRSSRPSHYRHRGFGYCFGKALLAMPEVRSLSVKSGVRNT